MAPHKSSMSPASECAPLLAMIIPVNRPGATMTQPLTRTGSGSSEQNLTFSTLRWGRFRVVSRHSHQISARAWTISRRFADTSVAKPEFETEKGPLKDCA
jgi:hypothetical protein